MTEPKQVKGVMLDRHAIRPATNLPTGYYRVRFEEHWMVVRWKPQANHWEGSGRTYSPDYFDEIGPKVC
jgi:hypothetical protein